MKRKTKEVFGPVQTDRFAGIYAEIAANIDSETAVKVYELFKGQTVVFPQRLYDREYVREYVQKHCGEHSIRELARMFGYSDRTIRQFMSDSQNVEK